MRSYYVYTRDIDNNFVSCNVQVSTFIGTTSEELTEMLLEAARKRIAELGYKLSRYATLRFVPDPRNVEDSAGYPPVSKTPDSYAVYSEYESGVTPTH